MHVDVSSDMQHSYTYMSRKDRRGTGNEKENVVKNIKRKNINKGEQLEKHG
jgi:hypothetical protein